MNWQCKCGREVPFDRECPTCSRVSWGWYGLLILAAVVGMVFLYRLLH